jgi:hypothetical protein
MEREKNWFRIRKTSLSFHFSIVSLNPDDTDYNLSGSQFTPFLQSCIEMPRNNIRSGKRKEKRSSWIPLYIMLELRFLLTEVQ